VRCFFRGGELGATASTDSSALLGRCLLERRLLDQTRLDELLEEAFRHGQRIGEALLAQGRVEPAALEAALDAQRTSRLASLLRLSRGDLAFIEGMSDGDDSVGRDSAALLARAMRAAYLESEIAPLLLPLRQRRLRKAPAFHSRLGPLGLDPEEQRALEGYSRGGVVAELVAACSHQRQAHGVLFIGLSAGLLTVDGSPL
jgi:hypothetical protein